MSNLELIAAGIGMVTSIIIPMIPPLNKWFYTVVAEEWRGLLMVGVALVVSATIIGLSCSGLFDYVACDKTGILDFVKAFLAFIMTNQSTYLAYSKARKYQAIAG